MSVIDLKAEGVALFKDQEWYRAIEKFEKALESLTTGSVTSCGSSVLYRTDSGDYRSGIVSDFDEGLVEVLFDDAEDEEVQAKPSKLTPIAEDRELQRSLYMNCARAEFKLGKNGRSANKASLALAVTRVLDGGFRAETSLQGEDDAFRKKMADGLSIRGQALLKAGKHVMAQQHADLLIGEGIDEAKGKALAKEVLAFRTKRMKSNRELSKQLASWVEVAMEENQKITKEQGQEEREGQEEQTPLAKEGEGEPLGEGEGECSLQ